MGIERSIDTEPAKPPKESHRLVDSSLDSSDLAEQNEEATLLPLTFADYIGQP